MPEIDGAIGILFRNRSASPDRSSQPFRGLRVIQIGSLGHRKAIISEGWSVLIESYGLTKIQRDLRSFSDFVRSLDNAVETIALRPGDRASLKAAVSAIEHAIDEQARRRPRHPETDAIARGLKETRRAALRQRFTRLPR